MKKKNIRVMDTSFRDGFQSVFGARVLTPDFLPAVAAAKEAGIRYFESGGGARFQSLYFYCNEDAFAMMDAFRETVGPDVELQTLSRGINVVGLESQSSDIIRLHAQLFKKHGVDTIRNFDALNDVNNLIFSGKCIVEAGLKHQVVVTMMSLPPGCEGAHTPEFYTQVLKDILAANIPFNSVCFKDASGTSTPTKVYKTVAAARKLLPEGTFINFHTHDTAGNSVAAYKAALEAGADGIDLAMTPVSGGTSQPDVITMWHALRDTDYDLGVDINKIVEAEKVFTECMKDYFVPPEARAVDPLIIFSPMPGGALTANTQMMRDSGILDRYSEVIQAMSEVVVKGGFGTSVTPVSQFYFQQAYNNVMFGPWKKIADGYGKMVLGYFGKTPIPADKDIIKIAAEQLELKPTTLSPLEINDKDPKKGSEAAKKKLLAAGLPVTDENIFITATCQDKGITWLKGDAQVLVRKNSKESKPAQVATSANGQTGSQAKPRAYSVSLENQSYSVYFEGNKAVVNGKSYAVDVSEISYEAGMNSPEVSANKAEYEVGSPLPGLLMRLSCKVGDTVAQQDNLFVIEAMKMETEVKAPVAGRITRIAAQQGTQLNAGQPVIYIG